MTTFPCRLLLAAALSACLLSPLAAEDAAPGKQTAHTFSHKVGEKEQSMDYLLYLPKDYDKQKDRKWPVMLFLHGAGERGSDISKVKVHGPPKLVEKGRDLPFIIISPQCPQGQWWDVKMLMPLVDSVLASHRGDRDRVYCTGLSMGGFGTWALCSAHPDRFAAAAPICGGGNAATVGAMKDIPTWVFHGDKDTAVKIEQSQKMVDALKAAGGDVTFTIYPGVGHDSWTKTYDDEKLYEWMLKHKRKPAKSEKADK